MKTRHRIMSLCFLLVVFTLPIGKAHAQWSEDGIDLSPGTFVDKWLCAPDLTGGIWVAYESSLHVRVQHVDLNGYKQLGEQGVLAMGDSLRWNGFILGVEVNANDEFLVVFVEQKLSGEGEYIWDDQIRVQKFSSEGERLFGPNGKVLLDNAILFSNNYWDTMVPDGAGGYWIAYHQAFSSYLYAIRMDDAGERLAGPKQIVNMDVSTDYGICGDGSGGCWIAWNGYAEGYATYAYQHLDSRGEVLTPVRRSVKYPSATYVFLHPDGAGGFYMALGGDELQYQYVNADGYRQWGDEGVRVLVPGDERGCYWPTYFEDGSFAFTFIREYVYNDEYHYGRVGSDGTFEVDPETTIVDSENPDQAYIYTEVLAIPDTKGIVAFRPFSSKEIHSESWSYWVVMDRISAEGELLWSHRISRDFELAYIDQYRAYHSADGHVLLAAQGNHDVTKLFQVHLFKVTYDGDVASVSESQSNAPGPSSPLLLTTWPNPFNASVTLRFETLSPDPLEVFIYDLQGRQVDRLSVKRGVGSREVNWRPSPGVASGIYFVKARSERNQTTALHKIVYLR